MGKTRPPLPLLGAGCRLVDSHCHLDMADYRDDLGAVLDRAAAHGVTGVVTIGTDLQSARRAVEIAAAHPSVRAAVGIHPHDADTATETMLDDLAGLAAEYRSAVVGYGEIGLDYAKRYADPQRQRRLFRRQLCLARELDLPVIIHDRDAHADCLAIVRDEGPFDRGGIMHCFSGDLEFARIMIDCNFLISIPGIVTYKTADTLRQVAAGIPLDRMVLETDGPYLAPVPYRGKRNEPVYCLYTAAAIAELRQLPLDEIAARTTANCASLFACQFD